MWSWLNFLFGGFLLSGMGFFISLYKDWFSIRTGIRLISIRIIGAWRIRFWREKKQFLINDVGGVWSICAQKEGATIPPFDKALKMEILHQDILELAFFCIETEKTGSQFSLKSIKRAFYFIEKDEKNIHNANSNTYVNVAQLYGTKQNTYQPILTQSLVLENVGNICNLFINFQSPSKATVTDIMFFNNTTGKIAYIEYEIEKTDQSLKIFNDAKDMLDPFINDEYREELIRLRLDKIDYTNSST